MEINELIVCNLIFCGPNKTYDSVRLNETFFNEKKKKKTVRLKFEYDYWDPLYH